MANSPSGTGRVVLQDAGGALLVKRVAPSAGFRRVNVSRVSGRQAPLIILQSADGRLHNDITVEIDYEWTPGVLPSGKAGPGVLMLPEQRFLPVSAGAASHDVDFVIDCPSAAREDDLIVVGVTADVDRLGNRYLQVVIA